MARKEKLVDFIKKYNGAIGIAVFLLIVLLGVSRGLIYSSKINSDSAFTYGIIYDESQDHYSYKFWVARKMYEGNLNNSHQKAYQLMDTLVIQYYSENPNYHVVHSKKDERDISQLQRKKVEFWEAW